jgi:hypothetical protein
MVEESGSGCIPLTSGSGRPKNTGLHLLSVYFGKGEEGGGGGQREGIERATVHKRGRKYQHDCTVSPIYKLYYKTPVKTTFRVLCLYSSFVHGMGCVAG